jgi:exodeoxyribonuclease-1
MARLLRNGQPRLWEYALGLRDKRRAAQLLDPVAMQPVLHVSQRYPAARLCAAAVLPLARHPAIDSRMLVFDLEGDPALLLDLDVETIAARLYARREDMAEGEQRVPLKEVHLNRCPALVAWNHLRPEDFERLAIDRGLAEARAERLRGVAAELAEKVRRVFALQAARPSADADASLYDGFLADGDRRRCAMVRATPPQALGQRDFGFGDPRLDELLFRYRARNWPDSLSADERARWDEWRRLRLSPGSGLADPDLGAFASEMDAMREAHAGSTAKLALLDALEGWKARLAL